MFSKKSKGATIFDDKKSGVSGLLWMLLGAIIVIITGLIAYKSGKFTFLQSNKKTEEIKVVDAPSVKLKTDTKEDNYEFYDILPDQEMSTISDDALISEIAQSDPTPKINLDEFKPDVIVTTDKKAENQKNPSTETAETEKTKTEQTEVATAKTADKQETVTTGKQEKSEQAEAKKATSKTKIVKGDDEIVIVYEDSTYEEDDKKPEKKSTPKTPTTEKKQAINKVEKTDVKDAKAVKNKQPSNKKSYILQINSYDEASQADKRRAQVLMAGVDAKVIKKVNGGSTVYQVVSTAMNKPSDVLKSQRLLQKNGIDSLIVEQRHK